MVELGGCGGCCGWGCGNVFLLLTKLHMIVAVVIVFMVVIVVSLTHLHMVELGGCGGCCGWGRWCPMWPSHHPEDHLPVANLI